MRASPNRCRRPKRERLRANSKLAAGSQSEENDRTAPKLRLTSKQNVSIILRFRHRQLVDNAMRSRRRGVAERKTMAEVAAPGRAIRRFEERVKWLDRLKK